MSDPTTEEIRAKIDVEIEMLWNTIQDLRIFSSEPSTTDRLYGVIEGLKRARLMTGEAWQPKG